MDKLPNKHYSAGEKLAARIITGTFSLVFIGMFTYGEICKCNLIETYPSVVLMLGGIGIVAFLYLIAYEWPDY